MLSLTRSARRLSRPAGVMSGKKKKNPEPYNNRRHVRLVLVDSRQTDIERDCLFECVKGDAQLTQANKRTRAQREWSSTLAFEDGTTTKAKYSERHGVVGVFWSGRYKVMCVNLLRPLNIQFQLEGFFNT